MWLPLLVCSAHALGGAFIGTDPTDAASSSATVVAVAVDGERATVTVTARAATESPDSSLIFPNRYCATLRCDPLTAISCRYHFNAEVVSPRLIATAAKSIRADEAYL